MKMEAKKMYKAAFASSDGKVVNQHFGHARQFYIVEIYKDKKEWKYVETRENIPSCNNGEHSNNTLESSCSLISDCDELYVAKIGYGALAALAKYNVEVYEAPYVIEDIIETVLN